MATLKTKLKSKSKSSKSEETKTNTCFINLGFEIEVGGEQVFINLPLSLSADNIQKAIESVQSRINPNTPDNMVEIFEGKIAIAEAVEKLFSDLKDGESLLSSEIDEDNDDYGFLNGLQVQFYKAEPKEAVDTKDHKKSVLNKLRRK